MRWTNVRATIGTLLTIVLVMAIAAVFAARNGYNIPVIGNIVSALVR